MHEVSHNNNVLFRIGPEIVDYVCYMPSSVNGCNTLLIFLVSFTYIEQASHGPPRANVERRL